jgi:hypothetical protein
VTDPWIPNFALWYLGVNPAQSDPTKQLALYQQIQTAELP